LVYLQPFRRNLELECALHLKIAKNSLKTPFWGIQGLSRSSMFTILKSLSPVLVMISSKFVPICNRFHAIRANYIKITSFRGYPYLTPSFEKNPLTQGYEILSRKTRDLEAAQGKNFVILACTVLTQITSVTDRQMSRRWLRRAKHSAIPRKKVIRKDVCATATLQQHVHSYNRCTVKQNIKYRNNDDMILTGSSHSDARIVR